jgi:hypothetical protein
MTDVLEIEVKQAKIIRVDGKDYDLAFPLSVVVDLENKLGRSMKSAPDWLQITTAEVPIILEAGLSPGRPDDEAKTLATLICAVLNPEEISTVIDGLCAAACPKAMARIMAEMEKARKRMQASQSN